MDNIIVQTPGALKQVIENAKVEELAEESEKKRRSKNLVIHGVNKQVTDVKNWANEFIKDLHINVTVNTVSRIDSDSVLLGFGCEEDKSKLFSNLGALKEYVDKYKGVSVVEDLTPDKRNTIKELSDEAKKLNHVQKSRDHVWGEHEARQKNRPSNNKL